MKNVNMNSTEEIITTLCNERNNTSGTKEIYMLSINHFEKLTDKPLKELLIIAETEEENGTPWKYSSLKTWLINYRKWCYENYKESTANTYVSRIITIFKHFEITVNTLPYFSTKQANKSQPLYPEDLPDREMLKQCIGVKNPLLKAVTLFMSSTGLSRVDTMNLTVGDYLEATKDYHSADNIIDCIKQLQESEIDVIPVWKLRRQKTGQEYTTFTSPEAVEAINTYLITQKNLTKDTRLFNIHMRYLNQIFKQTNNLLNLGGKNNTGRFTPQMLRRYHATQLAESGMSTDFINLLQGRKVHGVAHASYIRIKIETLKEAYINALPFIVISEIDRVKTELDVEKEKNNELVNENTELKKQNDETNARLDNLEKIVMGNISDDELAKLHKIL